MVTAQEKRNRKAKAKAKKLEETKRLEEENLEEEEEEDYEEEEEEETNNYESPLHDTFDNVQVINENVQLVHDRSNDRILLDIDYSNRQGISSTGKTIKIANASYQIEDKMKMSLNIYDKNMTRSELKDLGKFVENKKEQKRLQDINKALD